MQSDEGVRVISLASTSINARMQITRLNLTPPMVAGDQLWKAIGKEAATRLLVGIYLLP